MVKSTAKKIVPMKAVGKVVMDDYTDIRALVQTATDIKKNPSPIKTAKLIGFRGSGKSQFAIKEVEYVAAKYKLSPKQIFMCIVDVDIRGQDKLLEREYVVQSKFGDCIHKITIKKDHTMSDIRRVTEFFLKELQAHAKTHPDTPQGRFLLVENEQKLYQKTRDEYAVLTRGDTGITSERELMQRQQIKSIKAGKQQAVFGEGPRDSYKVINANFVEYYDVIASMAGEIGYNLFVSTHLRRTKVNWGKENEKEVIVTTGRPDLTDAYFDFILEFSKTSETKMAKGKQDKNTTYWINTEKSRESPEFIIENTGDNAFFWNTVKEERDKLEKIAKGG